MQEISFILVDFNRVPSLYAALYAKKCEDTVLPQYLRTFSYASGRIKIRSSFFTLIQSQGMPFLIPRKCR